MKVAFEISNSVLQACALFASKDETQWVLNGVAVEITSADSITFVGTDGRRLFAMRVTTNVTGDLGAIGRVVVIPSSLIEMLPERESRMDQIQVVITFEIDASARISMNVQQMRECRPPIAGDLIFEAYPNWRQVVNPFRKKVLRPATGSPVNGNFLHSFVRAGEILGLGGTLSVRLFSDPEIPFSPLLVDVESRWGGNPVLAIVMPMRGGDDSPERFIPNWAMSPEKENTVEPPPNPKPSQS